VAQLHPRNLRQIQGDAVGQSANLFGAGGLSGSRPRIHQEQERENRCQAATGLRLRLHALYQSNARYNEGSIQPIHRRILLADDKTYKAEYLGSGTFVFSKPKRKKNKVRQSQLKNPQRGSRK
jgi:hypothetical protein